MILEMILNLFDEVLWFIIHIFVIRIDALIDYTKKIIHNHS